MDAADPVDELGHTQVHDEARERQDVLPAQAKLARHQVEHVNRRALARGHGIRTGLEDTAVLPDGREASGNGELVAAAASLARGASEFLFASLQPCALYG